MSPLKEGGKGETNGFPLHWFPPKYVICIWYMYILSGKNIHLIIVSFFVYLVVNLFENMIHYNIGRLSKNGDTKIELPTKNDLVKIIIVMTIFAGLQGVLTYWFSKMKVELNV